jgi:hypothetical protein
MHAMQRTAAEVHESCSVTVYGTITEDNLLRRIRGEFREMPGMRLTLEQAGRLWDLDRATCAGVLGKLISARFLEIDGHGRYRKALRDR